MPYKKDLEDAICTSYDLIRQYEAILRFSNDPKEKARTQQIIAEQWKYIKEHLDDYLALCHNLHLTITEDLREIITHFPELHDVVKPESEHRSILPQRGPGSAVEVFISYAHEDERLRDELVKQLNPLQRQGLITCWYDRQITPGTYREREIDARLEAAQVVLLLISADFMASTYCYGMEMRRALERQEAGKTRVIPIILRPVDWHSTPFGALQALPCNGKPVTTWEHWDEAFLDIVNGVREVVESM